MKPFLQISKENPALRMGSSWQVQKPKVAVSQISGQATQSIKIKIKTKTKMKQRLTHAFLDKSHQSKIQRH
jgi:hypothetical protein